MSLKNADYRENFYIMGCHLADDICQGSLPAILAFMYQEGRLSSYAQVALLIMGTTMINAIVQPFTGYIADKKPRPYFMCLGMFLAAVGVIFLGFVENFAVMFLLVAINGIGAATFHPAAGKLANIFAGKKVGRGMSIFSVGGNIGYALGPLYFTAFYMMIGLKATLVLIVPALVMAVLYIFRNRKYTIYSLRDHRHRAIKSKHEGIKDNYFGTFLLLLLVFARSAAMFSLTTFLPLYFMHVLNEPEEWSTLTNTVIGVAGAVATVIGGSLADKFGFTQWTRFVSVLGVPFATCFLFTQNPILALLFLTCYALFYYGAMSPIVIIGQKLLPLHVGMATGITIGLGISFGGITAPLLGRLGDNFGLEATMQAIVFLVAISAVLSFLVPIVNRPQKA